MISQTKVVSAAVVAVLFALASVGLARAQAEADFEMLAAANSDALVTVKFVLRSQGGRDSEDEGEVTAVMVSAGGLVLTSNSQVGGNPAFMRRGAAPTPTDIKVYLGSDDQQGLEARMLARDSELDLVWFQIKEPGERKFAFIDFAKTVSPKVGDRLYTVVRLG